MDLADYLIFTDEHLLRSQGVLDKKGLNDHLPIRLPMNSMVDAISISYWGKNRAISAPATIIGIPTPTDIAFEAIC